MSKKRLTDQQKDLVQECFYRKRSGESYINIASSFGIDRRTLFGYRNSEEGQQIEKELRQNLINQSYESIMEAVVDKANQGSYQHAKLYMQVMGKWKNDGVEVKKEHDIVRDGVTPEIVARLDAILRRRD
ncbi:phBC6A51 family helix-turn-helix protein [Bacillus wiedmannii]|uniref:phBC6A51 family helix-turn-helix protein n=1 Tax=Bacillus wiedmannii TaxID=1890302 RepID=UPI003F8FC5BE